MLELNQIYCGDSSEVLKQIDTESIDLTVTSPPYDNLRTYKGYVFDFEAIAKELYRVTKQGGVVVWIVNDATINGSETLTSCKQKIFFREECGFNIHDTMGYWKNGFAFPQSNRYAQILEYMFIFSKGVPKSVNLIKVPTFQENRIKNKNSNYRLTNGKTTPMKYETGKTERNKENIWIYEVGFAKTSTDNVWEHPAIFPEKLARDHIYSWSNEGDLILDPFCGSGTTCKQALLMKRNYIGIEIAQEYVDLANRRIKDYKDQIPMEFPK